jgi:glyoxylase-like metal-dependent hydrolase (beta-lactamase superfamily II)
MKIITRPGSKHFSLQQIAEGVFAAIDMEGNAGLIDLGGQVVYFDTFQTPQGAQDLRQVAFDLFGRTQQIVVNSHWHNDHIWGNQVFANEAQILSSSRTRQLIAQNSQKEADWLTENAAQQVVSYQSQLKTASAGQRTEITLMVGLYEGLVETMPHLSLCLPSITFNKHLALHGTKRTAELINFENGHTASDTVLYLPQEGVLFMGDLLFVDCHPYLGDGDPQGLQTTLRTLGQMGAKHFVPGHGLVGSRDDLQQLINYIDYCTEIAQALVSEGNGYKGRIAGFKLAKRYQSWQIPSFFHDNISFLCNHLDPTSSK